MGSRLQLKQLQSLYLRLREHRRRQSRKTQEPVHQLVCFLYDREAIPMRSQHYICLNKTWTKTPVDIVTEGEKTQQGG